MSMGQPKGALVFSRRQREQLKGMAISGSLSARLAFAWLLFSQTLPESTSGRSPVKWGFSKSTVHRQ